MFLLAPNQNGLYAKTCGFNVGKYKRDNMTREELTALSFEIASDILTVRAIPGLVECKRAQMMLEREDGTEKNMGGRNKSSIAHTILPYLEKLVAATLSEPSKEVKP